MKHKRILAAALIFIMSFSFNVPAYEKHREPHAAFIGEVETVEKVQDKNLLILTVDGYIKGCQVEKGEIKVVLNEETVILPDQCPKEGEEPAFKKVDPSNFKVSEDDTIFVVLGDAITTDTQPQVVAKAIQIGLKN